MTTTCPACQKTVDSLRSRFVGVRDGKVVAYCSAECVAKGAAMAGLTPSSVPARLATPAVGGPARLATPPVGVPTARANTDVSAGPPRPVTPPPGVPISLESGPVIEIIREPASAAVTTPTPARADRTEPRAKHPDEIPIAAFWTTDKEKSGAVRTPVAPAVAVVPVRAPDDAIDGYNADEALDAHDAAESLTTARALSDGDLRIRRSRAPLVLLLLVLLGGGGFAIYHFVINAPPPAATETVPPAPRAIEPAPAPPVIDPEAAVEQARSTLRNATLATSPRVSRLAAAALARTGDPAAREMLARQLGLPPAASSAPATGPGTATGSAATGSAATGSAATGSAPETATGSAASADTATAGSATRAGSATATVIVETSDIARLDLAYSLARGQDKRGSDVLAAALASQRAEVRDEAARLLAMLRDPRAVPHLTNVLAVSKRRLGAAEHLAHLAEPRAIKALEQLRANPAASADDKARATIALGVAGHADVAPALRDMLGDAHFNAFAAAALAELKDAAARPVLERQLDSPVLRVRAARALRRLDPALDPRPLVAPLLELTRTGRDTDQVQAAEAVLLLCGSLAWSTFE